MNRVTICLTNSWTKSWCAPKLVKLSRQTRIISSFSLLALISFQLSACAEPTPEATQVDRGDLKNATQFSDISAAGPDSSWLVTTHGDLILISTQRQQHKADIESGQVAVVSFIDSMHGWVVDRKSRTWTTSDGGNSWQLVSSSQQPAPAFYLPQQLIFVDRLNGWLVGLFSVWQTVDGGKTWEQQFSVSTSLEERIGRLYRAVFINQVAGWVSSSAGLVIQTTDGGKTWKTLAVASDRTDVHDIAFSDELTGWLIGRPNGGIYRSEDRGATWHQQFSSPDDNYLNSVHFVNRNEGWAVGWRSKGLVNDREGLVLHTSNRGTNWSENDIGSEEPFFSRVLFYDVQHGWLVGRDNVYYTENGGESWKIVLKLPAVAQI